MKTPPKRPSDSLPPKQLQKAWDKYLDETMGGKPWKRPRWETLMNPAKLELVAAWIGLPEDYMKMPLSPKMQIYLKALAEAIPTLNSVEQSVLRRYYGLYGTESQTQAVIAKEAIGDVPEWVGKRDKISQQMIAKYLKSAKKKLKLYIRKRVAELAKESVQQHQSEEL
jgi:hypothetical protein